MWGARAVDPDLTHPMCLLAAVLDRGLTHRVCLLATVMPVLLQRQQAQTKALC